MRRFLLDDGGLAAVEYLAIGALAAFFLYGVLQAVFTTLQTRLNDVANQL